MDDLDLDVTSVVAGGHGLARDPDGRVVFVEGGLPGERVRAQVGERKRDFARATVVEVLDPSPERTEPPCPFVPLGCGGCDWQHVVPDAQRRLKVAIVVDALRRQARLETEVRAGPALPPEGYRTTMRGVAAGGRFGLRHRGSHDVVPIGPCLVAHPLIDELIREGRYPDGEIIVRAGARTGERLVIVAGDDPSVATVPAGVRVVTSGELRAGRRAWYHEEAAGRRWRISARSFFQARPDGAEVLVDAVVAALDGAGGSDRRLVDLYGGVGLFAGTIDAAAVTLVESGSSSAADARVNLADRGARIVRTDVARWRPAPADVVVADPPRDGLGRHGVAAVAASGAARLALVSCDAAAFARDARLLGAAGFALVHTTLVDLFPHTSHVELVSRFDRS